MPNSTGWRRQHNLSINYETEHLALRKDTGEAGRFRRFTHDWVAEHGDSLDIAWLKDESDGATEELPEPTTLAQEAMDELEGALEELRGILLELGEELEEADV
jgi:type I restriction enzyme M protein